MADLGRFCQEQRFQRLLPYFDGVYIDEIKDMSLEEITHMVDRKDRLLVIAFWNKHVRAKASPISDVEDDEEVVTPLHHFYRYNDDIRVLSFRGMVANNFYVVGKTRLRASELATTVRSLDFKDEVEILDLREDVLRDEDMIHVYSAVSALPKCRMVLLRFNGFNGESEHYRSQLDPWLIKILKLPHIEYVDMCRNMFATSCRKDFWDTAGLTVDEARKVIFVLNMCLVNGHELFPTKWSQQMFDAHSKYYGDIREISERGINLLY